MFWDHRHISGNINICDWKKGNITSIFKKGRKEDLVSYRLVSFMFLLWKTTEQISSRRDVKAHVR